MSPRKPDPVFSFTDKGIPTLAEAWDGKTVPPVPKFPETESGRRARGELEMLVEYVVKDWFVNHFSEVVPTAEYIAHEVQKLDGKPCSSGAVWGILEKWEEIGFAKSAFKPRRFFSFEVGAFQKGLPELYRQNKRKKKNQAKFGRFGWDQDGT
ncbi:hypothetical protein SEA_JUMBO_64 [Gordonia phage Jumbo]|uniref:Uncharacterized protein n=1 Tax=Gordonia phage Jumbo TaxID=1887650 RepID=A0A1B3B0Q0_9CAUD|nr:HTH DNA binding protein [Gordonia phage Jumbo]AOE44572.1 hypothetical protein SEA_JUMBO_64 [Gordonia phage Jumbo]